MKRPLAAVAAMCAALALPAGASAHATLVRSSPAGGAVLSSAPREARFVFDDVVRPAAGIRAVRADGSSALGGKSHVIGGKTLVVPLAHVTRGDYTVLWRVLSDDGHTEAGVLTFSVGTNAPPGVPALSASSGPSVRDVASRWLFFAGLLVAAGSAFFRLAVGPARVGVLIPAFVACFLGASGLLPHQGAFASRFAGAYAVATIVAALGSTLAAISLVDRRAAAPAWAAAVLMLPLPTIAGHAFDAGRPAFEPAVDVLHLGAAAVWIGGLVQLALALRAREPGVARRFSSLALVAVLVISATGVVQALSELSRVSQVWTTGYGRLLIVKTALLTLLVALGWLNRYRLVPSGNTTALQRSTRGELLLVAALIVAVAILTDARPGRDHAARAAATPIATPPPLPARDAVVVAQEDGDNAVALAAEPQRLRVTVLGSNGLGVSGLPVTIAGARAVACGSGCYERDGPHQAAVPVTIGGHHLVFRVPEDAPDASSLLARATRTFRRLRSVSYVERLASSPRDRIVSKFTLEAPDRIRYRIRGGASATVIGAHRWDDCVRSQASLPRQPAPIWSEPVTNAHLLARTGSERVVSFLNPKLLAWFTVRFDARTLRPRELEMTATAHFMHHTYIGFNAPRSIFPPRC